VGTQEGSWDLSCTLGLAATCLLRRLQQQEEEEEEEAEVVIIVSRAC